MSTNKPIDVYLKRLKKGESCLEEFYNAYYGKVKYIAFTYLVDRSFMDDVVLNTFCRIFDSIHTYDENQQGLAWVCKIAQNEAYKINNRERKHNHISLDEIGEEVASVNDVADSSEFLAALRDEIAKLDETDKKIVLMRLNDGLTYTEIGESLGMYVGTVFKRFRRVVMEMLKDIS